MCLPRSSHILFQFMLEHAASSSPHRGSSVSNNNNDSGPGRLFLLRRLAQQNRRRTRNGCHCCHYCSLTINAPYLYILHSYAGATVRSFFTLLSGRRGTGTGACVTPDGTAPTDRQQRPTDQPASSSRTKRNQKNRETTSRTNTKNAKRSHETMLALAPVMRHART